MRSAVSLWQLLANERGGLDWAGFDLACAALGIEDDIELMVLQLGAIKNHRPEETP